MRNGTALFRNLSQPRQALCEHQGTDRMPRNYVHKEVVRRDECTRQVGCAKSRGVKAGKVRAPGATGVDNVLKDLSPSEA
jgi:hypothetical protein